MHLFKRFLLLLSLLSLSSVAVAAKEQDATASLVKLLDQMQTIQAVFAQQLVDETGKPVQDVTGTMLVKRPGYFRWDANAPYAQHIVSDGQKLLIYDPDLQQLNEKTLDKEIGNTPAVLLSGDTTQIQKSLNVSGSYSTELQRGQFELTPRGSDATFEKLTLVFQKNELVEMHMTNKVGLKANIIFSAIQINKPLAASVFVLDIPDNVDRI
jgi:outer membrane lipoprotein carrier protein